MSASHGGAIPKGFQLPFLSFVQTLVHGKDGVHLTFRQLLIAFIVAVVLFFIVAPQQSINNFGVALFLSPIWLPIILYQSAHDTLGHLTKADAFYKNSFVLLELRIPRDIFKTPAAMETVFSSLHIGSGETTWYKRFFQGGTRPSWSFEIVSRGGRLHLYVWTREGYRRLLESFLYAQYPDIEIIEAEDYSRLVDPSEHGYAMFAGEYQLSDKKNNAYPLKTYIDYGMEPGDKPEESVDPMSQLLETIANIGPNEQFWIQIIIRSTKDEKFKQFVTKDAKPYSWREMVKEAIEEVRSQTVKKTTRVDPVTGAVSEMESFPNPTKGQSEMMGAIERKASKQIFDVGIRSIYLAPEESFQGIMIPAQINMFKAFNNENGNSLGLLGVWTAYFNDWPWEDRSGAHKHHLNHEAVQVYRRRAYFYNPYIGPWMNLSTEELATLFHIPAASVTTPNFDRIQSATASAPANLPS